MLWSAECFSRPRLAALKRHCLLSRLQPTPAPTLIDQRREGSSRSVPYSGPQGEGEGTPLQGRGGMHRGVSRHNERGRINALQPGIPSSTPLAAWVSTRGMKAARACVPGHSTTASSGMSGQACMRSTTPPCGVENRPACLPACLARGCFLPPCPLPCPPLWAPWPTWLPRGAPRRCQPGRWPAARATACQRRPRTA